MNKKMIVKNSVDIAMFILFLLLMSEFLLKESHLYLGIAATILFIFHNVLNFRWYKVIFKGKYNSMRIVQTLVNILLLVNLITCIISGILILPNIFINYEINIKIHLFTSAWTFILISIHLGLHWNIFVNIASKTSIPIKRILKLVLLFFLFVIILYGVHVFVKRRFYEEMFLLIDYQKEYDYSKSLLIYIGESIALSTIFISLTYYVKKIISFIHQKKKGNKIK